jgi:hypothetical protein
LYEEVFVRTDVPAAFPSVKRRSLGFEISGISISVSPVSMVTTLDMAGRMDATDCVHSNATSITRKASSSV